MKCAIILAGGKGTRMKADCPKVMCKVLMKPMIDYVVSAVKSAGCAAICVITGYRHTEVEDHLRDLDPTIETALQEPQLGTGHAVMCARDFIERHREDDILVLNGDGPLLDEPTINGAYALHKSEGNAIVEHKDATEEEKKINESNAGCYWFMGDKLLYALDRITNQNAQNEYYLTDSLSILLGAGNGANAYVVENSDVVLGANDRAQLHILNEILRHKIMHQLMVDGVDIPCTDGVMIADTVQIGTGTTILPGTILLGNTTIGKDCLIGPNTYIMDGTVGNGVTLDNVKLTDSTVEDGADAGPFVQIRGGSVLHTGVHIGDFVEVKNSTVGAGTKSAHLTYIGDSDVGAGVNFGCGTVTVNYDGKNKRRCKIGDGAFIGCNTALIAPLQVGSGAYIGAGSTITEDVPAQALGIARARQSNKKEWAAKHKK